MHLLSCGFEIGICTGNPLLAARSSSLANCAQSLKRPPRSGCVGSRLAAAMRSRFHPRGAESSVLLRLSRYCLEHSFTLSPTSKFGPMATWSNYARKLRPQDWRHTRAKRPHTPGRGFDNS